MWNKTRIIPNILTFRILPLVFMYILSLLPTLFNLLTPVHQASLSLDITSHRKPRHPSLNPMVLKWMRFCSSPERIFGYVRCPNQGYYWHLVGWARNAATYLPTHRTTPTQRNTCLAQISVGLSLRNPSWTHHSTSHPVLYLLGSGTWATTACLDFQFMFPWTWYSWGRW